MSIELVVIGGGNMGAALVEGIVAAGVYPASAVAVVEPDEAKAAALAEALPGVTVGPRIPSPVAADAGAVIAVKPGQVAEVVAEAAAAGISRVLSIAAGVTTAALQAAAGDEAAVVRAMPNTPALVGRGAAAIAPGPTAGPDDLAWAERILGAVGTVERVDEPLLDAVTAVSGSGPAYVFLFAEALVAAGIEAGLPAGVADRLTTQLLVGSAELLARRGDPAALRQAVTSPGGTTAAGLAVFEDGDLRGLVNRAVDAARRRSLELGM